MILLNVYLGISNIKTIDFIKNTSCFCLHFICLHAQCGCCSIGCLCFQVVKLKQAGCKTCTKNVGNYKWNTFRDIFGQLHTQEYKVTKKQIVRLQLNGNKSKESQTRLWVDTENQSRPEGRTWKHIIVILALCILFFDWLSFGEGEVFV